MVHAHGTGSIQNDLSEACALENVFSHRPFVISTKGVHGHALGASGAIELGICLKNDEHRPYPCSPQVYLIQMKLISLNLPMENKKQENLLSCQNNTWFWRC